MTKTSNLIGTAAALAMIGLGVMGWQAMRAPMSTTAATPTSVAPSASRAVPVAPTEPVTIKRSAPAQPPATRVASAPAAPVVGSEGYGPQINAARQSGEPAQALQAFRLLKTCRTNQASIENTQMVKDNAGNIPVFNQFMEQLQLESRRCQTVTAEQQDWSTELLTTAYNAHVPGAAAELSGTLKPNTSDRALRDQLVTQIRSDADAGDLSSMQALYMSFNSLDIPLEDRGVYAMVYLAMTEAQPTPQQWWLHLTSFGADRNEISQLDSTSVAARAAAILEALDARGVVTHPPAPASQTPNNGSKGAG